MNKNRNRFREFIRSQPLSEMALGRTVKKLQAPVTPEMIRTAAIAHNSKDRARVLQWLMTTGLYEASKARDEITKQLNRKLLAAGLLGDDPENALSIKELGLPKGAANVGEDGKLHLYNSKEARGDRALTSYKREGDGLFPVDIFSPIARERLKKFNIPWDEWEEKYQSLLPKGFAIGGKEGVIGGRKWFDLEAARKTTGFNYAGPDGYLQTVEKGDWEDPETKMAIDVNDPNKQYGPDLSFPEASWDENGNPMFYFWGAKMGTNAEERRFDSAIVGGQQKFNDLMNQIEHAAKEQKTEDFYKYIVENPKSVDELFPNLSPVDKKEIVRVASVKNALNRVEADVTGRRAATKYNWEGEPDEAAVNVDPQHIDEIKDFTKKGLENFKFKSAPSLVDNMAKSNPETMAHMNRGATNQTLIVYDDEGNWTFTPLGREKLYHRLFRYANEPVTDSSVRSLIESKYRWDDPEMRGVVEGMPPHPDQIGKTELSISRSDRRGKKTIPIEWDDASQQWMFRDTSIPRGNRLITVLGIKPHGTVGRGWSATLDNIIEQGMPKHVQDSIKKVSYFAKNLPSSSPIITDEEMIETPLNDGILGELFDAKYRWEDEEMKTIEGVPPIPEYIGGKTKLIISSGNQRLPVKWDKASGKWMILWPSGRAGSKQSKAGNLSDPSNRAELAAGHLVPFEDDEEGRENTMPSAREEEIMDLFTGGHLGEPPNGISDSQTVRESIKYAVSQSKSMTVFVPTSKRGEGRTVSLEDFAEDDSDVQENLPVWAWHALKSFSWHPDFIFGTKRISDPLAALGHSNAKPLIKSIFSKMADPEKSIQSIFDAINHMDPSGKTLNTFLKHGKKARINHVTNYLLRKIKETKLKQHQTGGDVKTSQLDNKDTGTGYDAGEDDKARSELAPERQDFGQHKSQEELAAKLNIGGIGAPAVPVQQNPTPSTTNQPSVTKKPVAGGGMHDLVKSIKKANIAPFGSAPAQQPTPTPTPTTPAKAGIAPFNLKKTESFVTYEKWKVLQETDGTKGKHGRQGKKRS